MTVRIVPPAAGALTLTFDWDGGPQVLDAGVLIAVDPGSALEAAIATDNLADPTDALLNAAGGGAGLGWTSNS